MVQSFSLQSDVSPSLKKHLWQYAVSVIILLVGVLSSVVVYLSLYTQEQKDILVDFNQATQERVAAIKKTTDLDIMALKAVRAFYGGSVEVSREELQVFAQPFVEEYPSIHAVAWVPRVLGVDRTKFEKQAAKEKLYQYQISDLDPRGEKIPAPNRNEYFPISLQVDSNRRLASFEQNTTSLGVDLATLPACRLAMERALNTGECVFSGKINESSIMNDSDIMAFVPVYDENANGVAVYRNNLKGYVVAILNVEWIVKKGEGRIVSPGINVELFDSTNLQQPELLYAYSGSVRRATDDQVADSSKSSPLTTTTKFEIAGREWTTVCTVTPRFIAERKTMYPWLIATAILIISGLLIASLFGVTRKNIRTAKLADQLAKANDQLTREVEDRELAEATLRTSETKYRALYEASRDAIIVLAPSGQFLDGNPAAMKMFGCRSKEDFSKLSPMALSPERQLDGMLSSEKAGQSLKTTIETGYCNVEWINQIGEDKEEFLTNISLVRMDIDGEQVVLATLRDITKQRRAEAALQASERRLRLFADNVEDVLWTMTTEGEFMYLSPSAEKILGFKWEEGIKVTIADITTSESLVIARKTLENFVKQAQAGERIETQKIVLELLRADGSSLWGGITVSGMYDESGEVIGALGVTRDITEQRRAEEALQASERRLRLFADNVKDVLWTVNTNEVLTYLSPSIEPMLGIKWDESMEVDFADIMTEDSHKIARQTLSGVFKKAKANLPTETQNVELELVHVVEGASVWTEVTVSPMYDESGEVIGALGVARDTAERRRMERELREAKEVAEAATHTKSQFLANMSHEIRTPMTAILGYADLLLNPKVGVSSQHNYVATIRRNGEHLLNLINDILDISKIEAGKMTLDIGACNIALLLDDVASMVRPRAMANNVEFSVEYQGEIPETILTDDARLRQAIINLAGNAVKFTEKGSVQIVVSFNEKDEMCDREPAVRIQVIDTGIGMKEEILEQLFQPFMQGGSSISHKYGGTGLGLAISRHIAHMLGGELTAHSVWEEGSTFTLAIPTGDLRGVAMVNRSEKMEQEIKGYYEWLSTTQNLEGIRVLFAEDGFDNRNLVSMMLAEAGAYVEAVENGKEAVDKVKEKNYDVILMDINMPVMDGYQAISLLRSKGYDMPIIAVTANAMAEDRDRCITAGCNEYISKPIDRVLLIKTIDKLVRGARQHS